MHTAWERETVERMLTMMPKQTVLETHRVCVTILQNTPSSPLPSTYVPNQRVRAGLHRLGDR